MTKVEELKQKIQKMYDEGMKNFHFTPSPEYYNLNEEERASAMLEWFYEHDKFKKMTKEEKIVYQLEMLYPDLIICKKLANISFSNKPTYEELEKRLHKIWLFLDTGLLSIENIVKKDDKFYEDMKYSIKVNNIEDLVSV